MVKEIITNNVRTTDSGYVFGDIRHAFVSPETHWADSLCEVVVQIHGDKVYDISLRYGSGGVRSEASGADVAYAISRAFQLAGARLEQLYKEHDYEGS